MSISLSSYSENLAEILKKVSADDTPFSITKKFIEEQFNSFTISEEKKAELFTQFMIQFSSTTTNNAMQTSLNLLEILAKTDKETALLDEQKNSILKDIDLKQAQITSLGIEDTIKQAKHQDDLVTSAKQRSVLDAQILTINEDTNLKKEQIIDRQQKRQKEIENMLEQTALLVTQKLKLQADTSYVETQEEKLIEQVEHNKLIKAMDSMSEMLGTVCAGGLVPSSDMWKVYFTLNKNLSTVELPNNTTVVKAS